MDEFNGGIEVRIRWQVKEMKGLPLLKLRGTTSNTELPEEEVKRILLTNAVAIILKGEEYEGFVVQTDNVSSRYSEKFNCDFSILFKNRSNLRMFLKNF